MALQPSRWHAACVLAGAVLASLLLASCARRAGSLSGCPLPCWQGITPGTTNAEAARASLVRMFGAASVEEVGSVLIWQPRRGQHGRLYLDGDRVGSLVLEFAPGALTVEDVLAQLGEPDAVHITLPHPQHSPDPDNPQCEVLRLVYSARQAEVRLADSRSGRVGAAQHVERVVLAPEHPALAIETPFYERPWVGYGGYCLAPRDIFD